MNASRVQAAVAFAQSKTSTAVRVYRYGCLIAEDGVNPESRSTPVQSFSLGKSIVSLTFGRAWTLGLIGPDDPVGALFPAADRPHGALTMRQLLTMTEGLSLNLRHDLNLTMPDRVRDLLTLPFVARPGTTFAYFQSGPPMVTAAIGRAVGEDFQTFAQRQLFSPIGITPGSWSWTRDAAGTTAGFWGLMMRPDDFARFGELLRRGGEWRGRRLLSRQYVRDALQTIPPFGCYAWFIWRTATARCNWTSFLGLPRDMWQFNGSMGQLVTVFPTQGVMTVRTGIDPTGGNWAPAAGSAGGQQEREFYDRVLGAITETPVRVMHPPANPRIPTAKQQQRYGSTSSPVSTGLGGMLLPPLPPAGPWRARAVELPDAPLAADPRGQFTIALHCPPRWLTGTRRCAGRLRATSAQAAVPYSVRPGASTRIRLRLTASASRALRHRHSLRVMVTATDRDATGGGTPAAVTVQLS